MKCPNCKYVSFEYLNTCKKCGDDLIKHKDKYHINYPDAQAIDLLSFAEEKSVETPKKDTAPKKPGEGNIDLTEDVVDLSDEFDIDESEKGLLDANEDSNDAKDTDMVKIDDNISIEDDTDLSLEDASNTITDNATIDLSSIETDEDEETSGDIDLSNPLDIEARDSEILIDEHSPEIKPEYESIVDESDSPEDIEIPTISGLEDEGSKPPLQTEAKTTVKKEGDIKLEIETPKDSKSADDDEIELDFELDLDNGDDIDLNTDTQTISIEDSPELDSKDNNIRNLLSEEESIELENLEIEPDAKTDKDKKTDKDDLLDIEDIELDD